MKSRRRFATLIGVIVFGMIFYPISERYIQEMFPFEVVNEWVFSHLILFYSLCGILLIITICWGIWGNIIFMPWKWSRYVTIEREIHIITPTKEQLKYMLPKEEKKKGEEIHIPNHIEKDRIRVKKKDLYKDDK